MFDTAAEAANLWGQSVQQETARFKTKLRSKLYSGKPGVETVDSKGGVMLETTAHWLLGVGRLKNPEAKRGPANREERLTMLT
jgi:hypothetical protein